jgi:hypothetical protein
LQIRNCGPRQVGKYSAVAKSRSGTSTRHWTLNLEAAQILRSIDDEPNDDKCESSMSTRQKTEVTRILQDPESSSNIKFSVCIF